MGLYTNNSGSNTNNSGYIWLYDGICIHYWLVVEPYPSEKYAKVSWDDDIPNIWKNMVYGRYIYPYGSQMGLYIIPNTWKVIKFHGSSHHQPVILNH